jgi:hypothetical protein
MILVDYDEILFLFRWSQNNMFICVFYFIIIYYDPQFVYEETINLKTLNLYSLFVFD